MVGVGVGGEGGARQFLRFHKAVSLHTGKTCGSPVVSRTSSIAWFSAAEPSHTWTSVGPHSAMASRMNAAAAGSMSLERRCARLSAPTELDSCRGLAQVAVMFCVDMVWYGYSTVRAKWRGHATGRRRAEGGGGETAARAGGVE